MCKKPQQPVCKKIASVENTTKNNEKQRFSLELNASYTMLDCAKRSRYGETSTIQAVKIISVKPDQLGEEISKMVVAGRCFHRKKHAGRSTTRAALNWDGLLTTDGQPVCSYPHLIHRFRQLRAAGWLVKGTGIFHKSFGQ